MRLFFLRRRPAVRFALALSAAVAASIGPAVAFGEGRAVAVSAELSVEDGRTRITIALSRPVVPTGFLLEKPDRAIVELPDVNCQLPAETARRRVGLVASVRCGLFAPGRTRLIVDLSGPATISRLAVVEGPGGGAAQLVLELAKADRETFRRAARSLGSDPDTTGSIAPTRRPALGPLVAIDAGHGGADSGAVAATGDLEKDVVLAFARALRDRLVAGGGVRVMMIRDGDVFVPLDERVRLARAAGADLFISIHGDSITSPSVRGATIYTGAERATDVESARLAERENAADALAGALPAEVGAGVSDILHELTLRETRGLSHRFAGLLHADLGPVTRFSAQPHREAGFRVLRAPDMTSVLVELGYLSNVTDANLLVSDGWRSRGAVAMAEAVERFFGPRLAGRAAVSP